MMMMVMVMMMVMMIIMVMVMMMMVMMRPGWHFPSYKSAFSACRVQRRGSYRAKESRREEIEVTWFQKIMLFEAI
jgi:hypothetical protein